MTKREDIGPGTLGDAASQHRDRPRVERLDPQVVSKIAAGEMILHPLSVAKELLENSLDAGARLIELQLGDRPDALISISDDGIGMTREDLELALETHATSKLRTEEDLLRVGSLGFRGEAVPSIGRVSRMEIRTSPDGSGLGYRAVVEGGELLAIEPISRSQGTTVRVEDLFYNSPVRKRFLRSSTTESRAIKKMVETYALAHPEVHFRLESRGESVLDLPRGTGLSDRIVQLHGARMLDKLLPLEERAPSYHIFGFVGVPELARTGSQHQTFLVNGRWVGAPWLTASLRQAFGDLLPPSKNPWAVLLLGLDPGRIDVNVHPTKKEIRFLDESELFGWLVRTVRGQVQSLVPTWNLDRNDRGGGWARKSAPGEGSSPSHRPWIAGRVGEGADQRNTDYRPAMGPLLDDLYRGPQVDPEAAGAGAAPVRRWDDGDVLPWETERGAGSDRTGSSASEGGSPATDRIASASASDSDASANAGADVDADSSGRASRSPDASLSPSHSSSLDRSDPASSDGSRGSTGFATSSTSATDVRPLWQLHRRYILAETGAGLLVIDQHAAHERILYERFLVQLESGTGAVQQLLTPLNLALEPEEWSLFEKFASHFPALGLDVEEFGKGTVLLRGVPPLWTRDPEQHFRDVLSDLSDRPSRRLKERVEHVAASFACRSAIKSGRPLSFEEMERLVKDLFATSVPHGDPHGRPTYIEVDLADLDSRFGRH